MKREYRICRTYRRKDGSEGTEIMMAQPWADTIRNLPGLLGLWDGRVQGYRFLPTVRVWVETRLIEDWHR